MTRPSHRTLFIDAGIILLVASSRTLVEQVRGMVHATSDLGTLFIPTFAWWWETPRWLGGWTPWVLAGFPANADPQYAPFHPLAVLFALASPLVAATLEGILAPALAGIGLVVYLRAIGCSRPATLVGGIGLAMSGYMVEHAAHPVLLRAVVGIPWALAALELLKGPALSAALAASIGTIVLSGHPQGVLYAVVPVLLYVLRFGRLRSRESLRAIVIGLAIGFAAAAPIATTTPELIAWSARASESMDIYSDPALGWQEVTRLVSPFAHGGAIGPFYGEAEFSSGCPVTECSGYSGMLPTLLLLAGAPLLFRDPRGRFWLALAVLGLVLSTGVVGAGHPQLRAPIRFLLWFHLGVAVASAIVLDRLLRAKSRVPAISRVGVATGSVVLLGVLAASVAGDFAAWRPGLVSLGILMASVLGLAIVKGRSRLGGVVLTCVLGLDMVLFAGSFPFGITLERYEEVRAGPVFLAKAIAATARPDDRALAVPLPVGPNWASTAGVQLVQGYGSLIPRRIADLLAFETDMAFGPITMISDASLSRPENHALDLLRVRVVAVHAAVYPEILEGFENRARDSRHWVKVGQVRRWNLYENRRARPVAWLVHRLRVVDDDLALRLIRGIGGSPAFDSVGEALTAKQIPGVELGTADGVELVRVEHYGEDEVRLEVRASSAALLVTSDAAYPGWKAFVNGKPAPVRTVNTSFRAVVVPSGYSSVSFRYEPARWRAGLVVAGLAGLLCMMLAFQGIRTRD